MEDHNRLHGVQFPCPQGKDEVVQVYGTAADEDQVPSLRVGELVDVIPLFNVYKLQVWKRKIDIRKKVCRQHYLGKTL